MTITDVAPPTPEGATLAHRHLVSPELWDRLVNRLVKNHEDIDIALARRIMNDTLGYLQLSAIEPSFYMAELVDHGWHTFLQYTREYAEFCDRIAGRFLHHSPCDEPGVDYSDTGTIGDTVAAMHAHGIAVDEELWFCGNAGCNCGRQCQQTCNCR